MSIRDYAAEIIKTMPEEKLEAFLVLFADENTLARAESEMMMKDPNAPRFNNVDDLFRELDSL